MFDCPRHGFGYGQIDYALARIHGRLASVPRDDVWASLAPVSRYHHFLDAAEQQGIGDWTRRLPREADVHRVEQALRQRYRDELSRLCHWVPSEHHAMLQWFGLLPYIEFVGHLYRNEPVFEWMHVDPVLDAWLADAQRPELVELQRGLDAPVARHQIMNNWLSGLQDRLPDSVAGFLRGRRGWQLVEAVVGGHPLHETELPVDRRSARQLLRAAHRHPMQPPLIPLYALLMYWMLLRLRAEVISRVAWQTEID